MQGRFAMPAEYDEYYQAFTDMVGNDEGFEDWQDLFESTGIDFESHAQTIDAFENFLVAFYPQEDMSGDDWFYVREEFYDLYGIDSHDIDWEAYREAIGY